MKNSYFNIKNIPAVFLIGFLFIALNGCSNPEFNAGTKNLNNNNGVIDNVNHQQNNEDQKANTNTQLNENPTIINQTNTENTLQNCTINFIKKWIYIEALTSSQYYQRGGGSNYFMLPADAKDINIKITKIYEDDANALIKISNIIVWQNNNEDGSKAHEHNVNIDISTYIKQENNIFYAEVNDYHQGYRAVGLDIIGTYTASSCSHKWSN